MSSENEWTRRDAWLGVLFLGVGALLATCAVLARGNELPFLLWGGAAFAGLVLLVLGGNALVRSLFARR